MSVVTNHRITTVIVGAVFGLIRGVVAASSPSITSDEPRLAVSTWVAVGEASS